MNWVRAMSGGSTLSIRVQPRASKTELAGVLGDAIKVRLQAPPVDGKANRALVAFLADRLGVPPSAVSVPSGATGRLKRVHVEGLSPEEVHARLMDNPVS